MRLAPRICGKAYRSPYSPRTVSLWPVRSPLMLDVYTSTWSQKNLGRRGGLGHPNGCPFHALPAGFPKFLPQPMFFESPPRSERCSQKRLFFFKQKTAYEIILYDKSERKRSYEGRTASAAASAARRRNWLN